MSRADLIHAVAGVVRVVREGVEERNRKNAQDKAGLAAELDATRAELERFRRDAERFRWLAKRTRWAGVHVDFARGGQYVRHRVTWYSGDDWPSAEGQSIEEAVDAAMEKAKQLEQSHE